MERCDLCGSPVSGRCRLCSRPACIFHLGEDGLCAACREALCMLCRERLSVARCDSCRRLVCVECSVQVDPVRRLCRECAARGATRPPWAGRPLGSAARLALRIIEGVKGPA